MRIYSEKSLWDFNFWAGAKSLAEALTWEELHTVEHMMEEIAPEEGWDETAINDFFWFEGDTIAEWLGYSSEAEILHLEDNEEEEEQEEEEA